MSKIKDMLIGYCEDFCKDEDELDEKDYFKMHIDYLISKDKTAKNDELSAFLSSILTDHENCQYWLMVQENTNTYNIALSHLNSYIHILSILIDQPYNLYYSPSSYCGWRVDKNVNYTQCLFIDIDDVNGVDFSTMEYEEIKNWLMENYSLPVNMLPNWLVCSGHGLHLYFLIDILDMSDSNNKELRKKYIEYLIHYFKADSSCSNLSRILRVPLSCNMKDKAVKTRLYRMNDIPFSLACLDFFKADESEVSAYIEKSKQEKVAKRIATMQKNKETSKKQKSTIRHKKASTSNTENNNHKVTATQSFDTDTPNFNVEDNTSEQKPSHVPIFYCFDFNPNHRTLNIIKDLNNYFCRHNGNINGNREMFVFILASLYRKCHTSKTEATKQILKYFTDDEEFTNEAITQIEQIYSKEEIYTFSNQTIAERLHFTDSDYSLSYCNYTEEQQKESQKAIQKKRSELNKAKTKQHKQEIIQAIRDNFDMPADELLHLLDCMELKVSRRQLFYIKKKIKSED